MTLEPMMLMSLDDALENEDGSAVLSLLEAGGDVPVRSELLYEATDDQLEKILALAPLDELVLLIEELSADAIAQIVGRLPLADAARLLNGLDPDDSTDVLYHLDEDLGQRLLAAMTPAEAAAVRGLLVYPPDTAGGRMTPEFRTVAASLPVDQAVAEIRRQAEEAETLSYVYVVDDKDRLRGVVSMRHLVVSPADTPISEIMVPDVVSIDVMEDQEEAARLLNRYHLLALPVVDSEGRLVGIVTADDVAEVVEEEATEDFHRGAAVAPLPTGYKRAPIRTLYQKRVPWLVALVFINIASSGVIAAFEDTLEATIALAFFIPLLIDSGGNAGAQSATLIIRAIATDDLRLGEWARALWKEVRVGLGLALTMGVAAAGLGFMRGGPEIGLIVFLAMVAIVMVSNLIGTVLPLILTRLKIDPATASGPLITSVADVAGLFLYFSIAAVVLGELG